MTKPALFHRNDALEKGLHTELSLWNRRSTNRSPSVALGLALVVLGFGCASVDPVPFTEFASALQPLRAATDSQAGAAAEASRQALVRKVASLDVSPADLQLEFPESSPFAATYSSDGPELNFTTFARVRQGLSALSNSMIAYAQSLVILAGGDEGGDILPTPAEFDEMAGNLNANSGTAAAVLKVKLEPGKQALLSTAAIQLFRAYIEKERRAALAEAIEEVQPAVQDFSTVAQQAVRLLASLIKTDYSTKVMKLIRAKPPNATPILALNDSTQATLATLESLWMSYGALPAAHRDLSVAASNRSTGLAGLIALSAESTRLNGLVAELATANAAAAAQPTKK